MWTSLAIVCILHILPAVHSQVPIPNKPLGILYNQTSPTTAASVNIDLFLDLACPDSKAAYPLMKQVADLYRNTQVQLRVFMFPLPYHRNAFLAATGTEAAYANPLTNATKEQSAMKWIEKLFEKQISWSDGSTYHKSNSEIKSMIVGYGTEIGYDEQKFSDLISDSTYNWNARVMWKYGCTRGVAATPWYLVNGISVDAASWTASQWKQVVDGLLGGRSILAM